MFRQFSILCSLGVFLALLTLLACDSGTTGGKDNPSSSSRSGTSNLSSFAGGDGTVEIKDFSVQLVGEGDKFLKITGFVDAINSGSVLSKVVILLGGEPILEVLLGGEFDDRYTIRMDEVSTYHKFVDEDCCEVSCDINVRAFINNDEKDRKSETITRSGCRIVSSSSEASSSSSLPVSNLSLSPVLFNGSPTVELKTASGNKGFNLSTGDVTAERSEASFYFDTGCMLRTNGTARFVTTFDLIQYGSEYENPSMRYGYLRTDLVSNPERASQFIFLPQEWESEYDYMEFVYYVACPSAKTEWDKSCYLIYANGICNHGDPKIEIKVWKAE